jgi:hypothetical protein
LLITFQIRLFPVYEVIFMFGRRRASVSVIKTKVPISSTAMDEAMHVEGHVLASALQDQASYGH